MVRFYVILAQAGGLKMWNIEGGGSTASNSIIVAVLLAAMALAAVAGAGLYVRSRILANQRARERARHRLNAVVEELGISRDDLTVISALTSETDIMAQVAALESRATFEGAVRAFRERQPDDPLLRRVNPLRQRLGFGFNNVRNPVTDTRLLPVGIKLQCRIPLPNRSVAFLTVLLGTNENQMAVRPPKAKGKPVDLTRFPSLTFRVSRENDAEYEFVCPVVGQSRSGLFAVALAHTNDIHRMLFRNAVRVPIDFPGQFYVVRQDAIEEKSRAALRPQDSQYVLRVQLKDLSIGGALAWVAKPAQAPATGDMVVFRLPEAQVQSDLVEQVVRKSDSPEGKIQLHLQFAGLKELDRLKLNRFILEQQETAGTVALPPGSPTSTPA
jgi:c-di-GMP-binding flagellar brake protein YcgR/HAMP domain-containing protein